MGQDYTLLGLPANFFEDLDIRGFDKLGIDMVCTEEEFLRRIRGKDVALLLFGVSSKRVRELFAKASPDVWLWASALSDGNGDHVQAMLRLTESECIPYAPPVVRMLSPLSFETKFRLIKATTFKYRGVEDKVDWELLRSTAQLWHELGEPDVRQFGRIRCWFSLREDLRKALDAQLGDEPLHQQPLVLEEIRGKGWSIYVPKTAKEVRLMGVELHNCLGSRHVERIKDGESIVLIIREDGRATHALEISPISKQVLQFSGDRHADPDPRIEAEVIEALKRVRVLA